MITSLKKLPEGKILINDAVVIYNMDFTDDDGITYSVDWDEKLLTKQEAIEVCETFIFEALENFLKETD